MTRGQYRYLKFFVFTTGLVVLVLELTASRLLAPYFGASIFIWANIIGLILIALAFGYWLGGRLADRRPEFNLLMKISILAGIYTSLVPAVFRLLAEMILETFGQGGTALSLGSFFLIFLLFVPPVLLIGMVSPFAVRLAAKKVEETGSSAGSLYAWSTVGSIVGTFVTAFVAIPFLGTRETIYASAALLLLIGAVGWRKAMISLMLLPLGLWFINTAGTSLFDGGLLRPRPGVLFERETPYQFLQVVERDQKRFLLTNDGRSVQSVYDTSSALTGYYYDLFGLLPPAAKETGQSLKARLDVLIIGLAGGSISRLYHEVYADKYDLALVGVDIDAGLIDAGRRYMHLGDQPLTVQIEDGRSFLRRDKSQYDVVVVDAYSNQLTIPFHLATREFFTLVKEHLNPGGVLGVNFVAPKRDTKFFSTFLRTVASAFPNVALTQYPSSANYLVMASRSPINLKDKEYPSLFQPLTAQALPTFELYQPTEGMIFTDNRAPVELMTDTTYYRYLWNTKK